uniref:Uncharacterized protein n=1 Tax=Populus trichocarpa TaxID=3694 RepID=A0A2K1YXT5_POPTR
MSRQKSVRLLKNFVFRGKNLETRFGFGNPNQSPIANAHSRMSCVFIPLSLLIRNSFLSSLRFSSLASPFFYWIYPEFLLTISRSKLSLSLSSIADLVLESCLIEITALHCDQKLEFFGFIDYAFIQLRMSRTIISY